MIIRHLKTIFLILSGVSLSVTLAQAQETQRVRIFHPQADMQFYVDRIEIAGEIPDETYLYILDSLMTPDEEGIFRYMLDLEGREIRIPMREVSGALSFDDTLRIWHQQPDYMTTDSVFINNNIPEILDIQDLYPREGRFNRPEVSLRGRTHPDAVLTLNGDTIPVFPSGAFAKHVQIQPGENHFEFKSRLGENLVSQGLVLTRPESKPARLDLDPGTALPVNDQWVFAGRNLRIGIKGPVSSQVFFRIPHVTRWQPLEELEPGRYETYLTLRDMDREIKTEIQYRQGIFSGKIHSAPLRILVEPLGGITHELDSRVYDTPASDQLLFQLEDSVSVQIIGLYDKMYHIKLGDYRTGYIYARNVNLDPQSRLHAPHFLGSLRSENKTDWVEFRIQTGTRRLPFEFKEKALPSRLELKVYGAKQGWEWTTYPDSNQTMAFIERSQPQDDLWQMDFYPLKRFWGWFARYEGNDLVLGIRKAPRIEKANPFANIRIEIDPGHGGWERGARGVTGYAEADANLRYSLKLEKLLTDAGATVFMTRRDDRRLSLPERAEIARRDSVHIFVMAHNNAPGSTRDIMTAKGASTFYTWPSSKALSDHIYPHLGSMGIDTAGEVARYYYYLTRQTDYLVYLIEGAFMTYPPEEMFLLSEEGLDALAMAAFKGLEEFVLSQAE